MKHDAKLVVREDNTVIESYNFTVLQKIFHSFTYDIREFAIDYLEISLENFLNSLSFLTYLHLLMYEIDMYIENDNINVNNIKSIYNKIINFLKQNGLYDENILKCIENADRYRLLTERIRNGSTIKISEANHALGLKVSDLELLKIVLVKINHKKIPAKKFIIFHKIDIIREVFDDIRDYEEDQKTISFNICYCYNKRYGSELGKEKLKTYIEKEIEKLKINIRKENDEKLLKIVTNLQIEKRYYFNKLYSLTM